MTRTTTRCSQCGVTIVDSKRRAQEFRCPCCDAVSIDLAGDPARKGGRGELIRRQNLDLSRFTIELDGTALFVRWNWSRIKGILGLTFLVFVFGVAVGGATILPTDVWKELSDFDFSDFEAVDLMSLFFTVGPFLMGVGLLHASLCCLFNHTEVSFCRNQLRVRHGPIPCGRRIRIPAEDLDRFEVYRKVTQSAGHERNDRPDVSFELHAIRRDGKIVRLIKHEDQSTLPKAVASLLTAHLQSLRSDGSTEARTPVGIADRTTTAGTTSDRITLVCPRCAGTLHPPPERAELRCRHCGADVPIPTDVQRQLGLDPARKLSTERLRESFRFEERGDTLFFAADWDRAVFGLMLKIGGVAVLIGSVGLAIAYWQDGFWLVSYLCGIVVAAGMMFAYIGICYWYNRTEVVIDATMLRIWHGPLPWRIPRPLPTEQLTQFVVRKNSYWTPADESDVRWDLIALSHYGSNQTLFSEISDREVLETVEYLIERRLALRDQAVRG